MSDFYYSRIGIVMAVFFLQCSEKSESSIHQIKDLKTRQYAVEGRVLYEKHCANCHQMDGTGLGALIPPLAFADYMQEDIGRTVRIIKYGMKGEIIVNGISYNQPMPANTQLTDLEIAELVTYLYNIWGNSEGLITTEEIRAFLK